MEDSSIPVYQIICPAIPTGSVYYFTTDSEILYEVRFGRRQDNYLSSTIVFGVLNDEFEGEEYVVTNKGEIYRVMATLVEIIKIYLALHPNINSFEYSGEPNEKDPGEESNTRIKLYERYLSKIFDERWNYQIIGNKTVITKIKK